MKIDWKSELKKNLKKQDMSKNITAINCGLHHSAVNRSSVLKDISKKNVQSDKFPNCSNCGLEMKLIENNTLWFCPLGCESRKAELN